MHDEAVVPACNTALIEGEPASEHEALLPPTVEAILEHGEFLAVMRRAIGTASFLVCINIVPSVIVIPIVVEI